MNPSSESKTNVAVTSKVNPSFFKTKKFWIIAVIIVVVVGGVTVTVLLFEHNKHKPLTVTEQKKQAQNTVTQINSGKYKAALDSSQQLVDNTPPGSPERYTALSYLGVAYMTNRQYDQALNAFLQAEAIKKDQSSYSMFVSMAQIYTQKGDKAKAIEYYQKAIARTKATPENADDLYIPAYEAAIKRLQQ